MTDLSPDFIGRVERLSLRPTAENALMPLFEGVSNALHAVDDRFGPETSDRATIKVEVLRADLAEEQSPVTGFVIEDNGIGLNEANFKSFCRLDRRHKIGRGGKGIGRLGWLKVFDRIEVDSTYSDTNGTHTRSFNFKLAENDQVVDRQSTDGCPAGGGTRVVMRGYTISFQNKCPANPETLLQRLAQHFLNVVVAENPITILVTDGSHQINLAAHVQEHVRANDLDPLQIQPEFLSDPLDLVIRHLRISKRFRPAKGHNRMLMFGNDRAANERNIDGAIGLGMLDGEEVYIGCVSGDFLDRHVNSERTGFTLSEDELAEVRRLVMPRVNRFLDAQVSRAKEQKRTTTQGLIHSFPQFLFIRDEMQDFVDKLKPATKSTEEVFLEMARRRYRRQGKIRSLGEEIGKKGKMSAEIDETVAKYRKMVNVDQQGVLAEYVLRRKSVLDLFDSLQEYKNIEEKQRYLEAALHSLVCPMGVDSANMEFEQHNLWMVDDRLAFFAYFNSDRQLSSYTDINSKERPDIAFFYDTCFAWRGEGDVSNTVVLIEFKVPGRDNYNGNDNPIRQVSDYVQKLRAGKLSSARGRVAPTRLRDAAYHCYIVADRTPTFNREINVFPHNETPDGEGVFLYIGSDAARAYVEIIPYDKLLRDAKLRQGIFFQKLGLNDFDQPKDAPPPPLTPEEIEDAAQLVE